MKETKVLLKKTSDNLQCAKSGEIKLQKNKKECFRLYATKKVDKKKGITKKLLIVIGGILIGLVNGFFGGGGGMIAVPVLEKVMGLSEKEAHATAIFLIFPLSLISATVYVVNGFINSFPLLFVTIGVILGGIFGAFILKFLPPKIVRIIFALIMLIGGIKLIL